jgi:tetratricopeptide (TPR) repeat protein
MSNTCGSHLRIEGPPAELTRLLTTAAAPTDAHYPDDTTDDHRNPALRVMHNLYPIPADVLSRPWKDAGQAWEEEHWGLYRHNVSGEMTRLSGRQTIFDLFTVNRPPHPWVAKVAADFPKLSFEHVYDGDGYNAVGRCVYRRGHRTIGWASSDSGRKPGFVDALLQTESYDNVPPLLKRLLRRRPNDARLYLRRARAYRKMQVGDYVEDLDGEMDVVDEAGVDELRKQILPDLEKAIALAPHFAEARLERASFLQDQGRLAEARAALDAAVRAAPGYSPAWRTRAEFRRRREVKGALRDVNRALKLDPHDPNAYLLRGLILKNMGRKKDARCDIERANALDPMTIMNLRMSTGP